MFPDRINQIPLCISTTVLPVSTAQTMNSLFSESNFHSPLKDEQIQKFTCQREFPLAMGSGGVEFSSPDMTSKVTYITVKMIFTQLHS